MIRRSAAFAALALAAVVLGSGCSTFTKNQTAAEANDHDLSVDELQQITDDLATTDISGFAPSGVGEVAGGAVRNVLNEWINSRLALDALKTSGVQVDDAALAAGKTAATSALGGDANFSKLTTSTQQFFIEDFAILNLVNTKAYVASDLAQQAYEAGLAKSKTLCMRFIPSTTQDAADKLYQQLVDGADFATLANAQPNAAGDGGVYTDATTSSPCVDATTVNASLQALSSTPIGQPSKPIELSGSDGSKAYYIILQRPWAEVADAALPLVRAAVGPDFHDAIYSKIHVRVDSRYGSWDPETQAVVAVR